LVLAFGLGALTVVVLASAALRLELYQEAYGWTELRLYVAVSIVALAVTLVTLAAFVATDRTRRLGHAIAVIGLASLVALNLLAPSAFVASRNVDRAIHPELVPPDGKVGLDASYLGLLPDDAVPVLVAALPDLPAQDAAAVRKRLEIRRRQLAIDPSVVTPAAWNLGRERARAALATMP
jgi:predicted anti-sigma-YlaC factor YlaD